MNIALIGASGFIGTAVLTEALARGHQVTALVTRPDRISPRSGLTVLAADVFDVAATCAQFHNADVVVSAFSTHGQPEGSTRFVEGTRRIAAAVMQAGAPRLVAVGGAGSLEVAPGLALMDAPGFPEQYRDAAEGARQALRMLHAQTALNWTVLSPSAEIAPGRRTGVFRVGRDQLLTAADGSSRISVEDFAMALVNELETPAFERARLTVGY